MAWGLGSWGISSWGGSNFYVTNHVPFDFSTGISRIPTISFTLVSPNSEIDITTINLTVNGTSLITNGVFTIYATGNIDDTDLNSVQVTANVLNSFGLLENVLVNVSAINSANETPNSGTSWEFTVNNVISTFSTHIIRKFERVFRVGVSGLDAPQNPVAEVELGAPELSEEEG